MKLKIPPVVVFIICLALLFGTYFIAGHLNYRFAYQTFISRVFLAAGMLSGIAGIMAFRMKSTSVDPRHPRKASSLVTGGIYQYSRNPMYLGLAMVLIGGAIRIGNPLCFLPILLFVWYMTNFQIKPEEEVLKELFGEEYREYLQQVRRWI